MFDSVFSIAALTSKRSLVPMPGSSAEEITVCPGECPVASLNSDIAYLPFYPIKFLTIETILRGVIYDLCVYVFITTYLLIHLFLVDTGSD